MTPTGPVTAGENETPAPSGDAAELATLRELRAAVAHFADTWAELLRDLPDSYDCHMNCAEANAAADLYRAIGDDKTAAEIIAAHAAHDEPDDLHYALGDDEDGPCYVELDTTPPRRPSWLAESEREAAQHARDMAAEDGDHDRCEVTQ